MTIAIDMTDDELPDNLPEELAERMKTDDETEYERAGTLKSHLPDNEMEIPDLDIPMGDSEGPTVEELQAALESAKATTKEATDTLQIEYDNTPYPDSDELTTFEDDFEYSLLQTLLPHNRQRYVILFWEDGKVSVKDIRNGDDKEIFKTTIDYRAISTTFYNLSTALFNSYLDMPATTYADYQKYTSAKILARADKGEVENVSLDVNTLTATDSDNLITRFKQHVIKELIVKHPRLIDLAPSGYLIDLGPVESKIINRLKADLNWLTKQGTISVLTSTFDFDRLQAEFVKRLVSSVEHYLSLLVAHQLTEAEMRFIVTSFDQYYELLQFPHRHQAISDLYYKMKALKNDFKYDDFAETNTGTHIEVENTLNTAKYHPKFGSRSHEEKMSYTYGLLKVSKIQVEYNDKIKNEVSSFLESMKKHMADKEIKCLELAHSIFYKDLKHLRDKGKDTMLGIPVKIVAPVDVKVRDYDAENEAGGGAKLYKTVKRLPYEFMIHFKDIEATEVQEDEVL